MIEVTCGACGTTHRFAEADVPPGGRAAVCTACKAKLQVPGPGRSPLAAGPSLAAFDAPDPESGGGTGDVIDLAELPAPKRASPLAGATGGTRPIPKSPLAGAPSAAKPAPPSALDLGDINLGLDLVPPGPADLPAPVGPTPTKAPPTPMKLPPLGPPKTPAGPMTRQGLGPGVRPGIPSPPAIPKPAGITDLPAPKRSATPATGVPTSSAPISVTDLPAPKRAAAPAIPDLPAPKTGITDLPAPKRASPARPPETPVAKGAPPPGAPIELGDGLAGGIDLPAPKGFFDDLPAPAGPSPRAISDLPAPKGFFDDLPAPTGAAPKSVSDLPAPKGFFDNLPAPTHPAHPERGRAAAESKDDLPAPKGFFDDLPSPAAPSHSDLPAPKGFFDDLPGPGHEHPHAAQVKTDTLRPGKPLDLDDLELAPHSQVGPLPAPPLDLEPLPSAPPSPRPNPATMPPPGRNVPALELPDSGGDPYGGLDLPPPTAAAKLAAQAPAPPAPASTPGPGGVVSFKPAPKSDEPIVISAPPNAGSLDLDIEAAAARARAIPSTKIATARKEKEKTGAKPKVELSSRGKTIALIAVLVAAAGAAGGYFYYKHYKKQKQRVVQLDGALGEARSELASGAPGHWDRASDAADNALALDPKSTDAMALGAEAAYGGLVDEGTNAKSRTASGAEKASALIDTAAAGPDVDKALALKSLVDGQSDRAAQRLGDVLKRSPNDADAMLYLAWAHLGAHAWRDAVGDFDRALKATPARAVTALYGRAQAKLALGDLDGARADYDAVLKSMPSHVGAQVGQAAAAPAAKFEERDTQLAALLANKDIGKADPRAVALAWTLWADDARLAGRLDAAGERYKHALELDPQDQAALIGQADLELRSGRADVAKDLVDRALKRDPNDVDANLLSAQIALGKQDTDGAMATLDKLAARQPPIDAAAQKTKLLLLRGNALAAQGKLDDALAAYTDAAKLAGDSDVAPTIAAVQLLDQRATAADQAKDAKGAAAFRQQAEDLLAPLAAKAQTDPAMAVTLGVAYLQSGAPERAEPFLAAAVAARPKDVEALFQLATAQEREGKKAESLATRQRAFDADQSRLDVGVALARDYEQAGADDRAGAMYEKLVASPEVTADVRARAGRFWARTGAVAKARAQGDELLKADSENPAGLYLTAEGLLADGKLELAQKMFKKASDYDSQAQYLDGLGRADEALWNQNEDTRYQEDAMRAYGAASAADPKMFDPLLGLGRLRVERNDFAKALEPLNAARAIHPDDGDVAYYLGVSLHGANRDKEAVAWLVQSNRVRPRAEAYKLLGEIYYDNDRAGDAEVALARAIDMAQAQEKQTGKPVDWLTNVLYEQVQVANSRNDLAVVKRVGQAYLDRNSKDAAKISEVQHILLGVH